ncbi:beta-glucan synthesis-associated protein [Cantharellus anzutake]|uniref:beta-glucan synthesis-associated protein n=1 Tax=Cantharellus anzutake TaxID=1750568 RepID=UPI0019046DF7|nr:beta-glucan synthesis-associated protein [Cantharellus anzutake]KAF8338033.1 beta-glucan synthesis-associated protein [Cantharellus anzutake]
MSRAPNKKPSYPFAGPNTLRGRSSPLGSSAATRGPPMPASAHMQNLNSSSTANLLSPLRTANSSSVSLKSPQSSNSLGASISDKYSLSADPNAWGTEVLPGHAEPDDYLHNPDPRRDLKRDRGGSILTARGIANLGFLVFLGMALITLFAGYPLLSHFLAKAPTKLGGYNIGGINATGQVPEIGGHFALIDPETPHSAYKFKAHADGSEWDLVFSDEFNDPNRTFYAGDDPYWEAVDLHYWQTGDLEWYDPSAVITNDIGSLQISLDKVETHNLTYKGGHLSTWNKFCFTGGYLEVNVSLPGDPRYGGLWPAVWMLGNLGRAGYGASLEGMWPYSYDSCDWGTLPNQTYFSQPAAALTGNDKYHNGTLSFLTGQRLSACTCPGEEHPGPTRSDGSFVGRSAPELDLFEAIVGDFIDDNGNPLHLGQVSQSCQFAPFTLKYAWKNGTNDCTVYNASDTVLNPYTGGVYQMAVSGLSNTTQVGYQLPKMGFSTFGVEYEPGADGYVTWYQDGKPTWTIRPSTVGPDPGANISQRLIPAEPLHIIMNLGISYAFGKPSPLLTFPSIMNIDYVRVYQDPGKSNIGCSPPNFPTEAYINKYIGAYTNPNYTTWQAQATGGSFNQSFPKNRLVDQC